MTVAFKPLDGLTSYEIALELSRLHDVENLSGKDIAQLVDRSQAFVSRKLKAMRNANPELLRRWKNDEVPEADVCVIAAILPTEAQDDALERYLAAHQRPGFGRPGIDRVKVVLAKIERGVPPLDFLAPTDRYAIANALRWVVGQPNTDEQFQAIFETLATTEEP